MRCGLAGCVMRAECGEQLTTRKFYSHSHGAVIRIYDESGNMIETHEHKGNFKEP
jgi:hypothetical protein